MLNYRLVRFSSTVIAALVLCIVSATAQVVPSFSKPRFIPKGPYQYDTTDAQGSITLAQETAGLLTREIDPRTYIVGPNDVLTVSVWATESVHDDVIVSPEGKIVLPHGGVIVVKGLSLDSVQTLVKSAIGKIFHQAKVDVSLRKLRQFKVYVLGAVAIPSVVTATAADHVFDVVERAGGVVDTASIRGVMLVRESQSEPITVDLQRYMSYGDKSQNPTVLGGDRIIVPLRNTKNVIAIAGEVKQEAEFPFLNGDSLSTLVRMSGGILPSARLDSVVLVRMRPSDRRPYREFLDLTTWGDQLYSGTPLAGDLPLTSGDRLYIRAVPKWSDRQQVIVEGEVQYPGYFAIIPNETRLSDVIASAGGFTEKASLEDAVVIRTSEVKLKDAEYERLSKLPPSEMSEGELQYFRTKSREVKGVMSIDFVDLFRKGIQDNNPLLRDGDSIYVPERNLYINITGSVRNPGRIVYQAGRTYLDYIELAGGYGFRADPDATLIVKVKGDQFPADAENYTLEPGDNILVLDEPETKFIDVFTSALTIAAQLVTIVGVILTIVRLQ